GPDGPQVVRLVQRRQRHVCLQGRHHPGVDEHRPGKLPPAVDDPVTGRADAVLAELPPAPAEQELDRPRVPEFGTGLPGPLSDGLAGGIAGREVRLGEKLLDLAAEQQLGRLAVEEDRKLEARRAGIQDKNRVSHGSHLVGNVPVCRALATRAITAVEARRVRTESARLVRTIGTRAPRAMPAPSAPARGHSCWAGMLPAPRSGTSRMSARPATGDAIFLACAAWGLMALSNASGPSRTPPVICPRSAILHSAAASMVDSILEVTVSTADRMATLGCSMPSTWARSMAFWTISTFSSSLGKMLTAASVIRSMRGYDGTSMTKTWLRRRDVRSPVAEGTTAPSSSSVWRLPFMSASTSPARASSTAFTAAAWLCGTVTTRYEPRSIFSARATA